MSGLSKKITCHYGGLESWQSFQPTGIIPRHCRLSRPLSLLLCYSATLQFCCCSCRLADSGGQTACCRSLCLSAAAGRLKVAASCKVAAAAQDKFWPGRLQWGGGQCACAVWGAEMPISLVEIWNFKPGRIGVLQISSLSTTILNHLNTQITPLSLSNWRYSVRHWYDS